MSWRRPTLAEQARGLLGLHHGLVALGGAVPEEGRRHVRLLHVYQRLHHCAATPHSPFNARAPMRDSQAE